MSAISRGILKDARKVVVKVGSSLLANLSGGINVEFLSRLVKALAAQKQAGRQMVLVSSGAVAAGCVELGLKKRPVILPQLQAAAAVGQCALMQIYREKFLPEGIVAGQVLLTRDDLRPFPLSLCAQYAAGSAGAGGVAGHQRERYRCGGGAEAENGRQQRAGGGGGATH